MVTSGLCMLSSCNNLLFFHDLHVIHINAIVLEAAHTTVSQSPQSAPPNARHPELVHSNIAPTNSMISAASTPCIIFSPLPLPPTITPNIITAIAILTAIATYLA